MSAKDCDLSNRVTFKFSILSNFNQAFFWFGSFNCQDKWVTIRGILGITVEIYLGFLKKKLNPGHIKKKSWSKKFKITGPATRLLLERRQNIKRPRFESRTLSVWMPRLRPSNKLCHAIVAKRRRTLRPPIDWSCRWDELQFLARIWLARRRWRARSLPAPGPSTALSIEP